MRIGEAVRKRIIALCKENKITVNMLATISGVPHSTLNNIVSERNRGTTVSTLQKLCDGLHISISDFFNDELFKNIEQEIR